jgi:adenylate cyclase
VIGDVVNVASRLCDLAKTRPARVLAAAEAVEAAGRGLGVESWRSGGSVQLRGRSTPTPVYEPLTLEPGQPTAGTYPASLR